MCDKGGHVECVIRVVMWVCEGWSCGVYDKGGRVGCVIRVVVWGV